MPGHLHALIPFNSDKNMSHVIGNRRRYHTITLRTQWQNNYFDHRVQNEKELSLKNSYILMDPVAKNLFRSSED